MKTEFFQSLGLTKSEIRVYLTLLSKGQCDARTIYHQSAVPFGKIYTILYSLENHGLVKVQNSRPKKFLAVEPEIAIKSLLEFKEKEMQSNIQSLFNQAAKVVEELKQTYPAKIDRGLFWSVAMGMENGFTLFKNVLNEAKRDVLIYSNMATLQKEFNEFDGEGLTKILGRDIERLLKNVGKNIKMKILPGSGDPNVIVKNIQNTNFTLPRGCEVRITPFITVSFILIDGEKVLFDVKNPIAPDEHLAVIYIWEKNLGKALKDKFDRMWTNAKQLK